MRESGLTVGVAEVARLQQVFALAPHPQGRLPSLLRAVLVKSAEDRAVFDRVFEMWIGRAEQDLSLREMPPPVPTDPGSVRKIGRLWLRRHFWRIFAAVALVVLSFTIREGVKIQPIKTKGSKLGGEAQPRAPEPHQPPAFTPDDLRKRTFTTWVPTLSVQDAEPVWQGRPPLVLGISALAVAAGLWLSLRKRRWFPPPAPEPTKKGPPRIFLTPPPLAGPQLLEAREEEALVWGIGHFVAEEPTRRLDLPATVRATARAAGIIPHLRFHQARYPREVWLWVDEAADDPALSRLADEVEAALQAHGLPVERALFRGVPDWLVNASGQTFAPNEVDERRDVALVAILTDGRVLARQYAADDRRVHLDALLRSLSHWPRLAFVDFSAESGELAALLPKHSLVRITPPELAAFLGSDEALQRRAVSGTEADAVWAAACAFAPFSVDEQSAFELRRRLGLAGSPWALRALRSEAPGPPGRLQWRAPDRARRVNWLREIEEQEKEDLANGSLLGRVLAFWEEVCDQELKGRETAAPETSWRDTPAYQHLRMERALLGLWRQREAPVAVRELYRLHGGTLREPIERSLREMAPSGWGGPELVHLPWQWEADRSGVERVMLQEMKLGGGMPAATVQKPGRLWAGMGICLGLAVGALCSAALSGKRPPEGTPVVVHDPGKPAKTWISAEASRSAQSWRVTVATNKFLTAQAVKAGARVNVKWESKSLPCLVSLDPGSEVWSCGTIEAPPRLSEVHGPRIVALAASPGAPEADTLAVDLIDSGSADEVFIGRNWRLALGLGQELLVLPESRWGELAKALRFEGTRTVGQVWPTLRLLAGEQTALLRGLSCRNGETLEEDRVTFVHICRGSFMMGSAAGDPRAGSDERPAHRVNLSDYWIGRTEVTAAQLHGEGSDTRPAVGVSWFEARDFCEKHGWRLPTEAEWEYAARAGTETAWSFGDDEKALGDYAWFHENSGVATHPVGTKKPNPWGIYDMHGNTWEWVADWYAPYQAGEQTDPLDLSTGNFRVLRGGAFNDSLRFLRSSIRFWFQPSFRNVDIGFRCARGLAVR